MALFGPTTVDGALAPLTKALASLQQVQGDRSKAADDKEVQIADLQKSAADDRAEAERAKVVLAKLQNLVSAEA